MSTYRRDFSNRKRTGYVREFVDSRTIPGNYITSLHNGAEKLNESIIRKFGLNDKYFVIRMRPDGLSISFDDSVTTEDQYWVDIILHGGRYSIFSSLDHNTLTEKECFAGSMADVIHTVNSILKKDKIIL